MGLCRLRSSSGSWLGVQGLRGTRGLENRRDDGNRGDR